MSETKIIYSGFHDAPLAFVASYKDKQYLFWRVFDETLDEYPDEYEIYILPTLHEEEIKESWQHLLNEAIAHIGKIHIDEISFDPTKRKSIKTLVLKRLSEIV